MRTLSLASYTCGLAAHPWPVQTKRSGDSTPLRAGTRLLADDRKRNEGCPAAAPLEYYACSFHTHREFEVYDVTNCDLDMRGSGSAVFYLERLSTSFRHSQRAPISQEPEGRQTDLKLPPHRGHPQKRCLSPSSHSSWLSSLPSGPT